MSTIAITTINGALVFRKFTTSFEGALLIAECSGQLTFSNLKAKNPERNGAKNRNTFLDFRLQEFFTFYI
ncbi:MAG: hypothetical protein DCF20_08015 [Pseudanabaena sp.]|nr:MAG: hypothetical protein DCF20_08015 [Pseudanabaena sp.]